MSPRLLSCTCSNIFQDDAYGPGQRVHTLGRLGWSCTTCGSLKPAEGIPAGRMDAVARRGGRWRSSPLVPRSHDPAR